MPRPRHRACSLGGVLGRPGSVLGASWGRLGAALGILGRLGSVLRALWDVLGASWNFLLILLGNPPQKLSIFLSKKDPRPPKIKPPLQREHDFTNFEIFKIPVDLGSILVPTWLHFEGILGILGVSGRLLGPLGGVLGPSWCALERPGASWGVLGASWRPKCTKNGLKKNLSRAKNGKRVRKQTVRHVLRFHWVNSLNLPEHAVLALEEAF
jgi:hypothetical protein